MCLFFFFQAEDGIRDYKVTGVQTCALPISGSRTRMSPSLGRSTRGPRGTIRKAGRRQRPTCARALRAGGVDPIADYLRPRKDIFAGSTPRLGSTGIDRVFSRCAEGLREYRAKCARVHAVSLQTLV